MQEHLTDGTLVVEVRRLIETAAVERLGWIRANARTAMAASRQDAVTISALTGIAVALGLSVADLERSPDEFAALLAQRRSPLAGRTANPD